MSCVVDSSDHPISPLATLCVHTMTSLYTRLSVAHVVCSGFKVAADGAFFSCIRLVGGASFAVLGGSDHVTFVVCCYRTTIDQVSILMLDGDLCSVHPSDLLLDLVPEDP